MSGGVRKIAMLCLKTHLMGIVCELIIEELSNFYAVITPLVEGSHCAIT